MIGILLHQNREGYSCDISVGIVAESNSVEIKLTKHKEKYRILTIAILLSICCFLAYHFHGVLKTGIVFSHFFYVPIILASIWWKRKGLFVAVFLALLLVSAHASLLREAGITNNLIRASLFIAVAFSVSILREKLARAENRLKKYAKNLEKVVDERTKELSESEEKYKSLVEASNDAIMVIENKGKIEFWNRAAEKMFGYQKDEILGKLVTILIPEEYREKHQEKIRSSIKQMRLLNGTLEIEGLRKNGSRFPIEFSISAYKGKDGMVHFASIAKDISGRKEAERALRESEKKYRTLVEHAYDWIWTLDEDGNFTYFNEAAERGSGYKFRDWVGKSFAPIIVPEDLPHVREAFTKALKGENQMYEVRIYHRSEKILTLEVNTTPIIQEGKIVGTVNFGRDITQQKELGQKLSTIHQLSQKMALSLDMDEIIRSGLDAIENVLDFGNSALFLVDEEKNELHVRAQRGSTEDVRLPLDGDKGVIVKVTRTCKPIIVPDTRKEPRYVGGKRKMLSEMAVPLLVKDRVIGVLNVESEKLNTFNEDNLKLLQTLASGMATAIEKVRLIASIQESEKLYKALFELNKGVLENSPAGIIRLNEKLQLEYENPEMKRILGVPSGEESKAIGIDIRRIPSVKKAGITPIFNNLLEGKEISGEIPFISMRGKKAYLSFRGVPIFEDDKFAGAILLINDITEQKKMEKALRESEEKYRTFMETASDLMYITNRHGNFIYVNKAHERTLGYKKDELLNMRITDIISKETLPLFSLKLKELIKNGRVTIESVFKTKHGKLIHGELTAVAVYDEKGNFAGTRAVFRDITERKQAEAALRQSKLRYSALSKRVIRLQEEERKRISRELHDEIGQALTSISIDLETIKRNLPPGSASIKKLLETQSLANEVTENIRRISYDLRPTILDDLGLVSALRWYTNRFSKIANMDVKLQTTISEERLSNESKILLYRAVQEALTNVLKHSKANKVKIQLKSNDKFVELRIEDNGVGFRVKKVLDTEKKDGSLGLLGMHERIKLVGGTLDIISSPGKGTKLLIRVPLPNNVSK